MFRRAFERQSNPAATRYRCVAIEQTKIFHDHKSDAHRMQIKFTLGATHIGPQKPNRVKLQ